MRPLAFSHSLVKILVLSPLLVVLALLLSNCAASNPGQVEPRSPEAGAVELKQIHTLTVAEGDQNTTLTIGGSTGLLFSDIRKTAPPTVSFYFPGTELVDIQDLYPINAPPIKDIYTSEVVADGHTAKITVNLLQDAIYSVDQDDEGITVSFSRDVLIEEDELPSETITAQSEAPAPSSETIDPAVLEAASKGTCIEMVDFKEQSDGVEIVILADGTITDYSAFTVDNPPRIVFDIYEINSPYKGLQKIEVDSKWVQGVRHFCYPEKLRVVLDTDRSYLTSFTSKPIKNGLLISVAETKPLIDDALVQTAAADTTAPSAPAPQMAETVIIEENMDSAPAAEMAPVIELAAAHETPEAPLQEDQSAMQGEATAPASESSPAWLNKLEFTSVAEGASLVSIGTTNPVRYDMARISERKLQLKLFNTRIPNYRKRPLITTRFKSAVDRITPIEPGQGADHAVVVFELREGVPFEITQVDNAINIRFSASTVPPKPLEDSGAPEWKQALEGTQKEDGASRDASDTRPPDPRRTAEDMTGQEYMEAPDSRTYQTSDEDVIVSNIPDDVDSSLLGERKEVLREEGLLTKRVDDEFIRQNIARMSKRYTGEKIALNFFDTDIRNVFRIIGEISGENFAIDKNVSGKVTLQFDKPVPWDQVLDLVLRMNQLGLRLENGIYRIATLATLAREEQLEQQKLESRRAAEESQELVTEFFLLSYISAQDTACAHLAASCDNQAGNQVGWPSKFSPRGSVSVDTNKNMIIANDIPTAIERMREIIRILDQVTPQVLIEARIVEASSDFRRDVGFDWGTVAIGQFDLGDAFTVTGIDFEGDNIPSDALDNGAIEWGLSKISGTSFDIIDARIQVGETEGKTRTISAPKILTLDGRVARIQQGFQIPYLERDSAGGSSVEFQDVDLELSVQPKVTPDNRINLKVDIKKDDVLDVTATQPPLSTNSASTELLMENGETVVIGGVMKANTSEAGEGIPGLRKIPALGFFFGFSNKNDNQTELLIFLTPEIVQLAQREVQTANIGETP